MGKEPALTAHCALTRNVGVVTSQLVKTLKLQHVILPTVNACVEQVLDAQICQTQINATMLTINAFAEQLVMPVIEALANQFAKMEYVLQKNEMAMNMTKIFFSVNNLFYD